MLCPKCEYIVERTDLPHVVRRCEGCGRKLHIHEPGAHGIGFNVRKGDQVVIPKDWLKLSLNPLKSTSRFSRYGLQWFAQQIHLEELPKKKKNEVAADTQGESLEELKANLRDLYADLISGEIRGIRKVAELAVG